MEIGKPISVVFSTRKINQKFIQHIKDTAKCSDIEILPYENNNQYSLTQIYNKGLTEAKNDIIVFTHDDIIFETQYWYKKLIKHFNRNSDYGIIGVAGTDNMVNGQWWFLRENMHGIVNHSDGTKKWTSNFSKDQGFSIKPMVIVDGLFFAVDRKKIKERFDEEFKGFHFYELPFCVDNFLSGVKIGVVTDIRLTHLSVGKTNKQWDDNKNQFELKYMDKFPFVVRTDKNLSGDTKITVITRTSNRPNSFNRCCDSIDNQTYKNIRHLICIDNILDIEYVKARNREYVLVNKEDLIRNDKSINPNVGPYSPHNLYMNEIQKHINDGWIIYLDDDDYFWTNTAVEDIVDVIEKNNENTMIFWRMNFFKQHIPQRVDNSTPPVLYTIGSPCFTYNAKWIDKAIWDGWKCSDYRVIEKLYRVIPKKVFIPKTFIMVPEPNGGNRKDI